MSPTGSDPDVMAQVPARLPDVDSTSRYGLPTKPSANETFDTTGTEFGSILMDMVWLSDCSGGPKIPPPGMVNVTVKNEEVGVFTWVGVPLITPVDVLRVRPGGSPDDTDQVPARGVSASSAAEYGPPTYPGGSDVVVITGPGARAILIEKGCVSLYPVEVSVKVTEKASGPPAASSASR